MGDIKLFRLTESGLCEVEISRDYSEKELHQLVEKNLEKLFGISFVAREYSTGRRHSGYIDTLGLDENGCPVIIEYKRRSNDNIISQGLYYLDWLYDHEAEFASLVEQRLGPEARENIEFASPRVLCVATSFSRYDERAVSQIDRNIELIRYRFFEDGLFLLERINSSIISFSQEMATPVEGCIGMPIAFQARLNSMQPELESVYFDLLNFGNNLGDDVTIRYLKHYAAMSRIRNFTCVQPHKNSIKLWLNLDPDEFATEEGFSRDVREIGHHASGNFEIELRSMEDLEKAKKYIEEAYLRN